MTLITSALKSGEVVSPVSLNDRYELQHGRMLLSGQQALVRLAIMQSAADASAGLKTAGYVSGYRGSPLGTLDQTFEKAKQYLDASGIRSQPAVNEDLAATAIWGTQQAGMFGPSDYDGVFAMWYGKGPGVHRSGDVLLHANLSGTSKFGGVLAVAGDDHTCKSSTNAHQSEYSFVDAMIPTLSPAGIEDILDLGLYGWALSRYSGCWTGMKLVADTVDSSATVHIDPSRVRIALPEGFDAQANRNIRWPDVPVDQERRLHEQKLPAALAFARANRLDRLIFSALSPRIGIVSAGKSYLDTLQALELLGLSRARAAELGVSLFKVAMVWPLEPEGVKAFCQGLDHVLVVEEKRPLIESQIKDILYSVRADRRPAVYGKANAAGQLVLPPYSDLTPDRIAGQILALLPEFDPDLSPERRALIDIYRESENPAAVRVPYFCSGCPHSTSTKVPQGSKSFAGIGCHYMVLWMDRATEGFTHMGGEGANWIGCAPYTRTTHMFQNMGDGTYFHSGYMAIRAAVSANVNITYKILFNDAVAMTGGQKVDGELSPLAIARQVAAEGVRRIAIVSEKTAGPGVRKLYPVGTTVHGRDEMDRIQTELRQWKGVSVLIYDQPCAAELRRRRKRKVVEEPPEHVVINELVCEGCGDCSKASNCLSITPVETEYGTKRQVDQSSCNKDYSCVNGFCPSFVTVSGGRLRKRRNDRVQLPDLSDLDLPPPPHPSLNGPYGIVVAGAGGTGVVTIGAILSMAAHLEGKACTTLDVTGMAQKGGPVASHVRIANVPEELNAVRVARQQAALVLGCDLVVAGSGDALSVIQPGVTKVILNTASLPTAEFVRDRDYKMPADELRHAITQRASDANVREVDADSIATACLGDRVGTNLFIVGVAYQRGLIPLHRGSIEKAIGLNGVAVPLNLQAFALGRLWVADPQRVSRAMTASRSGALEHRRRSTTVQEAVERRAAFLQEYQDTEYAARYRRLVEHVSLRERAVVAAPGRLTRAVAEHFFRLMAVKDEYETARLLGSKAFSTMLTEQFEGDLKLTYHLAPPMLSPRDAHTGLPRKIRVGGWLQSVFPLLARLKGLRGSAFDPFGYTEERHRDRLIRDRYEKDMYAHMSCLNGETYELIVALALVPDQIRGFGHVRAASISRAELERNHLLSTLSMPEGEAVHSETPSRASVMT